MTTFNFTTKREGYGRQGLYFSFDGTSYFIQSVFPNVEEHFGLTHENDCFHDEERNVYLDSCGNETTPYSDLDAFLTERFKEDVGRILYNEIDHDNYSHDFDNATYEQIAEWALNK